ncbi:MAG: NAD(P)-binding protein [Bryobacteraceae bacterium]|nr:NAD(P)-binding protein [Bryobacteraceae bacterium]
MQLSEGWIIGAGMTGLAASYASGVTALESEMRPGGICRSYLVPSPAGDYRFEVGGGHWVFGGDPVMNRFLNRFDEWKPYRRRSSVYFPESGLTVPYPVQNHLSAFGPEIAAKCVAEMRRERKSAPRTMAEALEWQFGPTLSELFFAPFHDLYTAGLWTRIAPQDFFKSPLDLEQIERGARGEPAPQAGYNQTFLYPAEGLDTFADSLAGNAAVETGARVARIDTARRRLEMADGRVLGYEWLLSTAPLDEMLRLAGVVVDEEPGPATAVLVVNLGGVRGPKCPDDHWLYVPRSRSGFHRVGFYSNVSSKFLPAGTQGRVSVYVERGFRRGVRPGEEEIGEYLRQVGDELVEWGFLESVEASASNWVETAYTWTMPGSRWRSTALARLSDLGIHMTGRYGKWQFQGIADSLRDGLLAGALLRARGTAR